jgi:sigma-B regulation protein RsbU (phosphoserine phosphatase)
LNDRATVGIALPFGNAELVDLAIRRAISALTAGTDAERQFDLAAARIQHALLDVTIPDVGGLQIGVHAEPSRLVGGDYIDLYRFGERRLAFALGDASGKSLAAALNAIMLRYLVRGLIRALGDADLVRIVENVNAVVCEDLGDGAFITFMLGVYDADRHSLRITNAGHEPPLLLRHDAADVETLNVTGIILGVEPSATFEEAECRLAPGDLVVTYTDGLTEATNVRGELYTIARLAEDLVEKRRRHAQEIADGMFEEVRRHAAGELRDDATILVLRALE